MPLLEQYLRDRARGDKAMANEVEAYEAEMNEFKAETKEKMEKLEDAILEIKTSK